MGMDFENKLRDIVSRACGHNDNFKDESAFRARAGDSVYRITVYIPITVNINDIFKKNVPQAG